MIFLSCCCVLLQCNDGFKATRYGKLFRVRLGLKLVAALVVFTVYMPAFRRRSHSTSPPPAPPPPPQRRRLAPITGTAALCSRTFRCQCLRCQTVAGPCFRIISEGVTAGVFTAHQCPICLLWVCEPCWVRNDSEASDPSVPGWCHASCEEFLSPSPSSTSASIVQDPSPD